MSKLDLDRMILDSIDNQIRFYKIRGEKKGGGA